MGSAIVRALIKQKESVKVMTRNPTRVPKARRVPGAYYVQGDILDAASIQSALKECDAVVHCVQFPGAPFEDPKKGFTYENIDGRGTEVLATVLKEQYMDRVLYISGAGAGQNRTEPWFVAKDRAEQALKENTKQWTMFRPSWMYGPQDQALNKIILSTHLPFFLPVLGDGKQSIHPLYVEDMARVIAHALNNEGTHTQVFEMGGPEKLSFNEMMLTMLEVLGKKRKLVHIPKPLAKLGADIINMLPIKPIITSDGIDFACMDVEISTSKAHAYFDVEFTDFRAGLQKYL